MAEKKSLAQLIIAQELSRAKSKSPLDRTLSANENMREKIAAAGEDDPTKKKGPSALEHILGPLDSLGAGVRSLLFNALSDKDVNPLQEMGKALKGEKRIEGADILSELGLQNKWGKMLGGIAVDILTDPVTYLTFGYGAAGKAGGKAALTTLAKHSGDDLLRLAAGASDDVARSLADDIGRQIGKSGDEVVSLVTKLRDAGHLDDAGRFTALVKGPEGVAESRKLLADLYSEFGTGGVKLAGIPLGGEKAVTKAGFKGKQALRAVPGSRWVEQSFGMSNLPGDAVDWLREGNEAVNAVVKTLRNQAMGGKRMASFLGDDLAKQLAEDIPDEVTRKWATVALSEQLGESRFRLADMADQVRDAMKAGDEGLVAKAMDDLVSARSEVLKGAQGRIAEVLRKGGLDDDAIEQATQGIARFEMRMDDLYRRQKEAGILRIGLFGDDATGYLPGVPGKLDDKTAGVLSQMGVAPEALAEQKHMGFVKGLGAPEVKRKEMLTPLDRALGIARSGGERIPVETEFDIARLGAAGVEKGESALALRQFSDDLATALGGNTTAAEKVAKGLETTFTDDAAVKGLLKAYDTALNTWKKFATVYRFPAFPARNTISNQIMLAQEGLWSPSAQSQALQLLGKMKKGTLSKAERSLVDEMVSNRVVLSYIERAEQVGKSAALPGEKFFGNVNELTENWSRMAGYIAAKNKGLGPAAAGEMVQKALLDYSNEALSVVEKDIVRRLVPFMKWTKGNLSKQARLLFTRPGSVSWLGHVKESGEAVADYDREALPDWMRDLYPIPLPIKDNGDPLFISTAGLFPQGDLELLSGLVRGDLDPKDIFGSLTPLLRTPIEFVFNKDLWYDSEIARYPGEKKRAPAYIERFTDLVENVPGLGTVWGITLNRLGVEERGEGDEAHLEMDAKAVKLLRDLVPWMQNISKMMDEQRRTPYDRIAGVTGVKPVLFERERFAQSQAYDERDVLQQTMARLKDEGRVPEKRALSLADLMGGK